MMADEPEILDISDEHQDWNLLGTLSAELTQIPKRGEKDFEPDGTDFQDSALAKSRQAMYSALSGTRAHTSKNHCTATWINEIRLARVEQAKGGHFMSMGRADSFGTIWLYPEELLYLVERGSLECFFPQGLQMSLQAVYACAITNDSELETYQIYSHLRKIGFIAQRHSALDPVKTELPDSSNWLSYMSNWGKFLKWHRNSVYRNYSEVFRDLNEKAPKTFPFDRNAQADSESSNWRVQFNVWKPGVNFKKSDPGPPDYHVAVVSARSTAMPNFLETEALLAGAISNAKYSTQPFMHKLKDGKISILLAVVDCGVVSFFKIAQVDFSEQKLYKELNQKRQIRNSKPRSKP